MRASNERQTHLSRTNTINLGAYYTAPNHVQTAWRMLEETLPPDTIVFDNACGYGGFLRGGKNEIACDIDPHAAASARARHPKAKVFCANALANVSRQRFDIPESARLLLIGNPPFNDRTSQIRQSVKAATTDDEMDADLQTRDLGISFLRSYDKLRADWVCVLHPLSYLIKRTNFARLGSFAHNYSLQRAVVISSAEFPDNSQNTPFPVVVALYVRGAGMSHDNICHFRFHTDDTTFAVSDFQYLDDFVQKYPRIPDTNDLSGIMFYTMRDINALRRNRTFVFDNSKNGVPINRKQLPYYIYADVFKQHLHHIPYYFGNSNIMIDAPLFERKWRWFVSDSARRHPQLSDYIDVQIVDDSAKPIEKYFRNLLRSHYVD